MRSIPTRVHGVLDYLVGLLLIGAPWLLGFARGGPESWVPVAAGATVILYSLFTDYEMGVIRRLQMPLHLWLDALGGLLLIVSPWLFGFDQDVWQPHVIVGTLELAVAGLTNTIPGYERRREQRVPTG